MFSALRETWRILSLNEIVEKAIEEFGTTKDGREAGYLLPNGELLDFSGKREGFSPNQRKFDHREIKRVIKQSNILPEDARELFEKNGPIRFGVHPEYADIIVEINVYQTPTEAQWSRLKQMISFVSAIRQEMSLGYDIYNVDRRTIKSEYILKAKPVDVEKIKKDLQKAKEGSFDKVQEYNILRWARGL